jgi:hypothetical protein
MAGVTWNDSTNVLTIASTASFQPNGAGTNSTMIGSGTTAAGGLQAVAIGHNAIAANQDSVVIGTGADDTGLRSVAIGVNADAGSNDSVTIGNGAAGDASAVAIGFNSDAAGSQSVAVGYSSRSPWRGVAIGPFAFGGANYGIAIGQDSSLSSVEALLYHLPLPRPLLLVGMLTFDKTHKAVLLLVMRPKSEPQQEGLLSRSLLGKVLPSQTQPLKVLR